MSSSRTAAILSLLLTLFVLRVVAQALVGVSAIPFLPAWSQWYSGLLPYPWLLASQLLIILVFGKASIDVARERGFFARPRPAFGTPLIVFGVIYIGAMIVRYAILRTHAIPILFHFVLAAFFLVYGNYQRRAVISPG
jgi:hypothetical protein